MLSFCDQLAWTTSGNVLDKLPSDDEFADGDLLQVCQRKQQKKKDVRKQQTVRKQQKKKAKKAKSKTKPQKATSAKKKGGKKKIYKQEGPGWKEFILGLSSVSFPFPVGPRLGMPPTNPHHFWEVFSPPRVSPVVSALGKLAPRSLDIKTGWDFTNKQHVASMITDLDANRPLCVLTCPPCTTMSRLMATNWWRMRREKREDQATVGMSFVDLSVHIWNFQLECAHFYIFEHPEGSLVWQRDNVNEVPGDKVSFDQCMLGLKAPGPNGKYMKKRTTIKTNVPGLANALRQYQCHGRHEHQRVEGQINGVKISQYSAQYPADMCSVLASHICRLGN